MAPRKANGSFAARTPSQKWVHTFYLQEAVTPCSDGWLDADVWRPNGSLDTPQAETPGLRAAVTAGDGEPTGE